MAGRVRPFVYALVAGASFVLAISSVEMLGADAWKRSVSVVLAVFAAPAVAAVGASTARASLEGVLLAITLGVVAVFTAAHLPDLALGIYSGSPEPFPNAEHSESFPVSGRFPGWLFYWHVGACALALIASSVIGACAPRRPRIDPMVTVHDAAPPSERRAA